MTSMRDDTSNFKAGWWSDKTINSRIMRAPTYILRTCEGKSHVVVFAYMLHLLNEMLIYLL